MSLFLGIDAGTTVVKSVLFDHQGQEVAAARREVPTVQPSADTSELEMVVAWDLTAATIREVLARAPSMRVQGVGLCGTACGVWPVAEDLTPTRRAILWNDGRAAALVKRWQASGFYRHIFTVSGNAPFPGYPLITLAHLQTHEPDMVARTRWFLFHKDWLRLCLTGQVATDSSDLAYFPGDIRTRALSPELLQGAGLMALRERIPEALAPSELAGVVSDAAARATGLSPGTPVVAGAVDVLATALGGGCHRVGQACTILGTSLLTSSFVSTPSFDPPEVGVQTCVPGDLWLRSFVNTTGTLALDWFVKTLADDLPAGAARFTALEEAAQRAPLGARGLLFLPFLNTAGIVYPFVEPGARGVFFGLSAQHTRDDLIRAVYEGVAYAMRESLEAVKPDPTEVYLVGGGARSAFWAQLFADVTGKRILIPEGSEFGARGAALLAGVGTGHFPDLETAVERCVRVRGRYQPNASLTRQYNHLYALYCQLTPSMREGWRVRDAALSQLQGGCYD